MQIEGHVALVTGGASGLGAATVKRLLGQGAQVAVIVLAALDDERLENQSADQLACYAADVTREDQVTVAVERVVSRFERIDIVVNCAGIGVSSRTVRRDAPHDLDDFKRVTSVNLFGTFSVLSQAAFHMAGNLPDKHGCRGVIVNTSSIAAFDGQIGQAAYAASKGAIVGMTLPVARDLASLGIRCCTICPGTFDTPLLGKLPEERKQALAEAIPHPARLGNPTEYGLLVEDIITNPYLNGETIRLDAALRMAPN